MRFHLFLLFLLICCLSQAQTGPFCLEKSSRNSYAAGNDTALSLYKAISQTSDSKILLFTVKKTGALFPTPTIASVRENGDLRWVKAVGLAANNAIIRFDAITLHDNSIFLFLITRTQEQNSITVFYTLWLTEDGSIIRQQSFSLRNGIELGSGADILKLKETAAGNILFMLGSNNNPLQGTVAIGNLGSNGQLQWSKMFTAVPNQYFTAVDIITYDDLVIVQGFTANGLHSTKLRLADGAILSGKCHKIFTGGGIAGLTSRGAVLTPDYKIKTLGSSRIFEHYEIYFSYTQDTALNMVQSTNYFTLSSIESYLPNSVTLNKRGMTLIKSTAGTNPSNIGFFIANDKDSVLREWTINSDQGLTPFYQSYIDEVAFDNNDSLYVYWNGKKDGKDIVGWVKTGFETPMAFCGAKDSSFIQTLPIRMGPAAWTFSQLNEDMFESTPFAPSIFSPVIRKELGCEKITGFCNPIKIHMTDTVCSITQPVIITVTKNPECRGKVLFGFDTTAVTSWQQPDDTTLLLHFDKSWNGEIYAGSSFCPMVKDTARLVVNAPLPGIDLGKDTILCKGDTLRLFAGGDFTAYMWQNGLTTSFQAITTGGLYHLTVKDNCRRSYSDTIKIALIDKKVNIGADISICKKETIGLTASGNFVSYAWTPAYNINNVHLKSVVINPEITTAYRVTAITAEGCLLKDTILVTVKDCPQTFFMPTAFTPNSDGKNDLLRPIFIAPPEQYEFSIYNRWGQRIFHSTDKTKGWNGKLDGVDQDSGSFVWICTYKFYEQSPVSKKGTFLLIR